MIAFVKYYRHWLGYSNVRAFFLNQVIWLQTRNLCRPYHPSRYSCCQFSLMVHFIIIERSLIFFFFAVRNVYWFPFMPWPIRKIKRYTIKVPASTGKVISSLLSPSTGLCFLSFWLLELKNNHFQVQAVWWCIKDECQLLGCTEFFRLDIFDSVWHEIV